MADPLNGDCGPSASPTPCRDPDHMSLLCTASNDYCGFSADNGGVHTNSGVPNHAYALLVDGGSFNDVTVEAILATMGRNVENARALIRAATERDKPNEKRLRGYTDSQLPLVEQRVSSTSPIHMPLESLKVTFGLEKLREILGHDHPIVRKTLGNESPESMANRLIANTSLDDPAVRKKLWEGGLKAVERSKDPIIRLMRAVDGDARELLDRYLDEYQAPLREAHHA